MMDDERPLDSILDDPLLRMPKRDDWIIAFRFFRIEKRGADGQAYAYRFRRGVAPSEFDDRDAMERAVLVSPFTSVAPTARGDRPTMTIDWRGRVKAAPCIEGHRGGTRQACFCGIHGIDSVANVSAAIQSGQPYRYPYTNAVAAIRGWDPTPGPYGFFPNDPPGTLKFTAIEIVSPLFVQLGTCFNASPTTVSADIGFPIEFVGWPIELSARLHDFIATTPHDSRRSMTKG